MVRVRARMIGSVYDAAVSARKHLREFVAVDCVHHGTADFRKLRRPKIAPKGEFAVPRSIVMGFLEMHVVDDGKRRARIFPARYRSEDVYPALFQLVKLGFRDNLHVGNSIDRRHASMVALVFFVAFECCHTSGGVIILNQIRPAIRKCHSAYVCQVFGDFPCHDVGRNAVFVHLFIESFFKVRALSVVLQRIPACV